jgi:hypothetical protein
VAGSARNWLLGCGIGCGVVIVLGMLLAGGGYLFVRSTLQGIEEVRRSYDELVEAHGEIEDWTPPRDGAVPAARMEIFLGVRDSLSGDMNRLDARLAEFPANVVLERGGSLKKVIAVFRGLRRLVPSIADYLDRRNRLLLAEGMGAGEYTYIYCLNYYSFLGHSPDDGPVIGGRGGEGRRGRRERLFGDEGTFGRAETWNRYRRDMLALLRNQLRSSGRRLARGAGRGGAALRGNPAHGGLGGGPAAGHRPLPGALPSRAGGHLRRCQQLLRAGAAWRDPLAAALTCFIHG